jgi:2-phosphosulfolactate phosphatase
MRIHVALGPSDFPDCALAGGSALVVDVVRATTSVVAAFGAGCRRIIPVADEAAARRRAADEAGALLAGERGGDMIAGFDLGNSPREFTAERVGGRTVILTTSNGTHAMLAAAPARRVAVAALSNAGAAARWAAAGGLDLTVLCAGDTGALSLEDAVCAGIVVRRVAAAVPGAAPTEAAMLAAHLAAFYEGRLERLAGDSRWARRLVAAGHQEDIPVCLALDSSDRVPTLEDGVVIPETAARVHAAEGAR